MSSMYPHSLSYHANKFSEKIRHMNDTNSQSITLRADEARNLHTDIFALLARIAASAHDSRHVRRQVLTIKCSVIGRLHKYPI
jgi:hypothetical protein